MSEVLDNKVTISSNGEIKSTLPTIWGWERKKCVIVHSKVIDLLNDWGYGLFNKDVILRKISPLSVFWRTYG